MSGSTSLKTCLAAVGMAAFAGGAMAQSVLVGPPQPPPPPPPTEPFEPVETVTPTTQAGTNQHSAVWTAPAAGVEFSGGSGATSEPREPFQWRNLVFRPHLTYRFVYGTGIPLGDVSKTNSTSAVKRSRDTVVQTFSPGMLLAIGDHWSIDYTPSLVIYSDPDFDNVVNHLATVTGQTTWEDWAFGVNASANLTSDPQTETGTQTEQQIYLGTLLASRQLSGSLSMDITGTVNVRETERFTNSRDYSVLNWLNQQIGPNIGVGLGFGAGYRDVDSGTDTIYEQILARFVLNVTGKITLSLNGGGEIQQFVGQDSGSTISPIFGAVMTYRPFEPTSISLRADRTIAASYFENQTTETTTLGIVFNQRLLRRFNFSLQGGYTINSFRASMSDADVGREDEHTFVTATLSTSLFKRGTASIFYTRSENTSDENDFEYSSNQVGFQLGYTY